MEGPRHFARPDVILFAIQVIAVLVVIIVSLLNISLHNENLNLWTMMLTSSLGYLMPNPKFKIAPIKGNVIPDETIITKNGVFLHDIDVERGSQTEFDK